VTRGDKHSFGSSAQGAPEVVNLWAADGVSPSLNLGLQVSSCEEFVSLIDIGVHVYSTVAGGAGDGNANQPATLEHNFDKVLEIVRSKLEQSPPHGFQIYNSGALNCAVLREWHELSFRTG
jgi:hypothetical protein